MSTKSFLTLLFTAFCVLQLHAATVTVQGRKILLNGSQFNIQGVDYSPVPVGYFDYNYAWGTAPAIYNSDLPLIKSMGVNTIRTYREDDINTAFLNAAYNNGIYVIVGWGENLWGRDFTNPSTTAQVLSQFTSFINTYKNHPAVLMWCFGNEVEDHTNGGEASWYALLQEAAVQAQSIDPSHPVTTANAEIMEIGDPTMKADDASLSSGNFVWGVNVYRGKDFSQAFFTEMSTRTALPFFISEFGCDAWNGTKGYEDDALQDTYIRSQWADISANLASSGNTCSGGLVFEWCDEWWKGDTTALDTATMGDGGVNGAGYHDTENDWINTAYTDDIYMNEEWWGIVSVAPGTTARAPRLAYNSLRSLWSPYANVAASSSTITVPSSLFQGGIKSYPNPLLAGRDTARIQFTVNGGPGLEVIIFDLAGRKIFQPGNIIDLGAGVMVADWNGKDDNNNIVPAGLYICRVRAKTAIQEETRYWKIAVVK